MAQSVEKNFHNVAYVKHAEVSIWSLKLVKHLKVGVEILVGNSGAIKVYWLLSEVKLLVD